MSMLKVSIIIPVYNVEKYLRECLDSIVGQSLKEIEILCVNDGSTDHSLSILEEYASRDDRVQVISKPNSGYGHTMNTGLARAKGKYIGIVESDDFAAKDMFEVLYSTAEQHDVEVVKANYFAYRSVPVKENNIMEILPKNDYNQVIDPTERTDIFRVRPCIWAALYKRELIVNNDILFNETPGASYQDAGFNFKIWACAKRVYLLKEAYLHYRTDNENSSVKSKAKIYCVCDEYHEIERFLEERPEKKEKLEKLKNALKYEAYRWNLERLTSEVQREFLMAMREEFLREFQQGKLDEALFPPWAWRNLMSILDDPDKYLENKQAANKKPDAGKAPPAAKPEPPAKRTLGKRLYRILQSVKKKGVKYTLGLVMRKLKGKPGK